MLTICCLDLCLSLQHISPDSVVRTPFLNRITANRVNRIQRETVRLTSMPPDLHSAMIELKLTTFTLLVHRALRFAMIRFAPSCIHTNSGTPSSTTTFCLSHSRQPRPLRFCKPVHNHHHPRHCCRPTCHPQPQSSSPHSHPAAALTHSLQCSKTRLTHLFFMLPNNSNNPLWPNLLIGLGQLMKLSAICCNWCD